MHNNYTAAKDKKSKGTYEDGRWSVFEEIDRTLKLMPENEAKCFVHYWKIRKEKDNKDNNN